MSEPRLGAAYEAERVDSLAALGEEQEARRVDVGGLWAVVFHDAATLRAAVEESLRARRISDPGTAAGDAAAAAALGPASGDLAAVVLVDASDAAALADRVAALGETPPHVHLEVAGHRVTAVPATPAAAMPVVFALRDSDRASLRAGATVALVVEHRSASARAELTAAQRDAVSALAGV